MSMKGKKSKAQGFTLVEMALVLLIVGIIMVFTLPVSNVILNGQRRSATVQNLKNVQAALNNFVTLYKRLPCPADGTAISGTEAPIGGGNCTGNQANGVVPWVTLGLTPTDARDAWSNQITYRVGWGLTQNNALNMSSCDPAGTRAVGAGGICDTTCVGAFSPANCTSPQAFLANKGLNVYSDAITKVMDYANFNGAAYILISHGANGYGAISSTGGYLGAPLTGIAGTTLEDPNKNLPSKTITAGVPPQFIDATFNDGDNPATYFDDIIVRPSLLSVITQAQLGPRSH